MNLTHRIATAAQAGLPTALRYTDKTDWGPRLGFAWRPYGNETSVFLREAS